MTYDTPGLIVGGIRSFRSLVAWIVTRNPCNILSACFQLKKRPLQAGNAACQLSILFKATDFSLAAFRGALTWQLIISWTLSFTGRAMTKADRHSSHHLPSPLLGRHATYFFSLIFFSLWTRTLGEACLYTAGLV
ncbi:hypothetical protein LI328DRAFT_124970, partial [Trichoderma asperelloides]